MKNINVYYYDDEWNYEWSLIDRFTFQDDQEAENIAKKINDKINEFGLDDEYKVDVTDFEFSDEKDFKIEDKLSYLWRAKIYRDREKQRELEREQARLDDYNNLTDEQKESYDSYMNNLLDAIAKSDPTSMQNMFAECKDFHTIAMEEAKNENK